MANRNVMAGLLSEEMAIGKRDCTEIAKDCYCLGANMGDADAMKRWTLAIFAVLALVGIAVYAVLPSTVSASGLECKQASPREGGGAARQSRPFAEMGHAGLEALIGASEAWQWNGIDTLVVARADMTHDSMKAVEAWLANAGFIQTDRDFTLLNICEQWKDLSDGAKSVRVLQRSTPGQDDSFVIYEYDARQPVLVMSSFTL